MTQGKNITSRFAQVNPKAPEAAPLCFTPERAVAAIVFHLIDERVTKFVSNDSAERTINRLRHESFALSIPAPTWAVMSNADRLRRLLEETATEAGLLPDDMVILAHRARKKT